jgi:hypothetical protein
MRRPEGPVRGKAKNSTPGGEKPLRSSYRDAIFFQLERDLGLDASPGDWRFEPTMRLYTERFLRHTSTCRPVEFDALGPAYID